MNTTLTITPRRFVLLGVFGLMAMAVYGFAASNNVDPSNAGDGSNTISGYDVENVHYVLNDTNPSTVDEITFDLTPALVAGGETRISLDNGATWLAAGACTGTSTVTCDAAGTTVLSLANLKVIAAQ